MGVVKKQQVIFECKHIIRGDCRGIGHTQEECRHKKYEVALRKIKPKQFWIAKEKVNHIALVSVIVPTAVVNRTERET